VDSAFAMGVCLIDLKDSNLYLLTSDDIYWIDFTGFFGG